ncbi:MAG: hypothetical protein SGPRY_013446, partial [Prymnesium sp.]
PANFVFQIWPVIGALQLISVSYSALLARVQLRQSDLSALFLANVCATSWLLISSNAMP